MKDYVERVDYRGYAIVRTTDCWEVREEADRLVTCCYEAMSVGEAIAAIDDVLTDMEVES